MASQLDVRLHGDSISIAKKYGPLLRDVVQSKFGCKAEFYGVGSSMNSGYRKPTVPPEEKFSVVLEKGLKVSVWKADLTSFQVDAVVNAANDQLQHYGGLAYALSRAGGPVIQQESDAYIKQKGQLKTGDAVPAAGGALPCKMIIHAVGPCLPAYPSQAIVSQAVPKLEKAVISILKEVEKHGLQSVAIPALSSGLFNFPLQQSAEVIVSTLKEYHDKTYQNKGALREIHLVNNDAMSVQEMHSACQKLLSTTTKSYSSAVGTSYGRGASNVSTTTVQVNNVTMTLKKGKIEEQRTDVIVNTTSHGHKLSEGQISKAISQKAGYEMQNEIDKYGHSHPKSVMVTSGYRLLCKEVYHTLCVSSGEVTAKQILYDGIWQCLSLVATKPHKSIAFPAIGTGLLGFSGTVVAKIMTSAMVAFAHKYAQVNMDIDIVIFPSDNDTFKAFEDKLKSLQSSFPSTSSQGVEHSHVGQAHAGVTPNPQIRLTNAPDEEIQEAKEWLEQLLFNSEGYVVVPNNFLQYFGEQEFQQLHDEAKQGVFIEEFFDKGHAGVMVKGESYEDVIGAALLVEAMLCKAQRDFVNEEAGLMTALDPRNFVSYERRPCEKSGQDFRDRANDPMMRKCGLKVVRVDRVENRTLLKQFELKRKQLQSANQRRMYQRIRGQFCNMVSHVGFQREYAPPDDPLYGDGIYFTGKVNEALEVWKGLEGKYLYFVEAQVLTGKAAFGKPGLIGPPPINDDPLCRYDSLKGDKSNISVIFNGHQALPEYIIICTILMN